MRKVPFRVYNPARSRALLADRAVQAARAVERLKGLLGRGSLEPGEGLLITPCTSIHTFFMRFAIDVIFLDGERRVVRTLPDLPPWRATRVYPSARSVLELPAGTIARSGTMDGDQLEFEGELC